MNAAVDKEIFIQPEANEEIDSTMEGMFAKAKKNPLAQALNSKPKAHIETVPIIKLPKRKLKKIIIESESESYSDSSKEDQSELEDTMGGHLKQ